MLSRLVITFLPKSKRLLISWLKSPSAVILEPPKIKSDTVSTVSPSISHTYWTRLINFFKKGGFKLSRTIEPESPDTGPRTKDF